MLGLSRPTPNIMRAQGQMHKGKSINYTPNAIFLLSTFANYVEPKIDAVLRAGQRGSH